MAPRSQPGRIDWVAGNSIETLNASLGAAWTAADEMFQLLFDDLRNGAVTIDANQVISGILVNARGGTGTGTVFTPGSVVFTGTSGAYTQNNAGFFWDNTNSKLGIGTASPAYELDILKTTAGPVGVRAKNLSTAAGTASASLFVENSTSYGQVFKAGTGYTTYKTLVAGDLGFYNITAGNISVLNDSGNINFAANGASTAMLTITSAVVTVAAGATLGPFGAGTGVGLNYKPDASAANGRISVLSSSASDNLVINAKGSGSVFFNFDATSATVTYLGTNRSAASDTYLMTARSTDAFAADKGGNIGFEGIHSSGGSVTSFGSIGGRKDNNVDGDYGGYLQFLTRAFPSGAPTERIRILSTGQVGIGVSAATAILHLKAGTATASTAPLKLTSGTSLTAAEAGTVEYDGTSLFFTPGAARKTIAFLDSTLTGTWNGTKIGLLYGGTNADLSGTGGTSQFLKQASAGATITVVRPTTADLSDFAETTWTPTDASGAGLSLTITSANYTQVGNRIFVSAHVVYPATASGANASIGGLPFTVSGYSTGGVSSNAVTAVQIGEFVTATTTFQPLATASATPITNVQLSGAFVIFQGAYKK